MSEFEHLFGTNPKNVQPVCVLTPYLTPGFLKNWQIKDWRQGRRYSSGNAPNFTLIQTHIGAGFVGDAVQYLNKCQALIFFGSGGLVPGTNKDLKLGSLVIPETCYCFDSYHQMLIGNTTTSAQTYPDQTLLKNFLRINTSHHITPVCGASVASIFLEKSFTPFFQDKGVQVLDMECAAFYATAQHIHCAALALLYISDVVGSNDLIEPETPPVRTSLKHSLAFGQIAIEQFAAHINK